MRRRFAVLVLLILVSAAAYAQSIFQPNELWFKTRDDMPMYTIGPSYDLWWCPGDANCGVVALTGINGLISKYVPFDAAGKFYVPRTNLMVFHTGEIVSYWNGVLVPWESTAQAYTWIFSNDAPLTEIAPRRNGNLLVAEAPHDGGAKLIEFNLGGKVAEYAFGGANHIDLMSDQCTLLYTSDDPRVRRMNVCTGQQESDFVTLFAGESAGAVREMPNGDVLVAAGDSVQQFHADGSLWMYYPFAGATNVALTSDGSKFWAAGVANRKPELRIYEPASVSFQSVAIGNVEMQPAAAVDAIEDLEVTGEWRASMAPPRLRAVRR